MNTENTVQTLESSEKYMHPYDTRYKSELRRSKKGRPSYNTIASPDLPASSKRRGYQSTPAKKIWKGSSSLNQTLPVLPRRILPKEPAQNVLNGLDPLPFCGNSASTKPDQDGRASDTAVEAANLIACNRPTALIGTNALLTGSQNFSGPLSSYWGEPIFYSPVPDVISVQPHKHFHSLTDPCRRRQGPARRPPILLQQQESNLENSVSRGQYGTAILRPSINDGAMLSDSNRSAHQDLRKVMPNPSLEEELSIPKVDMNLPGEGLGFLGAPSSMSWDSFLGASGLNIRADGCILGEISPEQDHHTSSPAMEKDEQEFTETAEAMRMRTMMPDGFGFLRAREMQQQFGTYEDDDDDGDVKVKVEVCYMEAEEEGMGNNNDGEGVKHFLGGQDERRRGGPVVNWGHYRPSADLMAMMAREELGTLNMGAGGYEESWNNEQGQGSQEFADFLGLFGSR